MRIRNHTKTNGKEHEPRKHIMMKKKHQTGLQRKINMKTACNESETRKRIASIKNTAADCKAEDTRKLLQGRRNTNTNRNHEET